MRIYQLHAFEEHYMGYCKCFLICVHQGLNSAKESEIDEVRSEVDMLPHPSLSGVGEIAEDSPTSKSGDSKAFSLRWF